MRYPPVAEKAGVEMDVALDESRDDEFAGEIDLFPCVCSRRAGGTDHRYPPRSHANVVYAAIGKFGFREKHVDIRQDPALLEGITICRPW
jgi:hypothetical protein